MTFASAVLAITGDAFFAAVAGMGFGSISDPPLKAFPWIALLAATGHAVRFCLMNLLGVDIASASFVAALIIGMMSSFAGSCSHCPMTVLYIPALLPMVPGIYAYKTVFSLIMFFQNLGADDQGTGYLLSMLQNASVTVGVVTLLAVGATIPVFIMKEKANQLTRNRRK